MSNCHHCVGCPALKSCACLTRPGSCVYRSLAIVLVGLLGVLALGLGMTALRFDASYRTYFDADDPMLVAFDSVSDRFDPSDSLLLLVVARPGESVYSPGGLELVRRLTDAAAGLPRVGRVDSLANHPHIEADAEGFTLRELLPDGPVDAAGARALRSTVQGDELVEGVLVDREGTLAVVALTLQPSPASSPSGPGALAGPQALAPDSAEGPAGDRAGESAGVARPTLLEGGTDALSEHAQLMRAARALLAAHATPGFELHLSGIVAMNHAFAEATEHDLLSLFPLAFALLFLFVAWALRSVVASLHVFALSLATQVAALGALGWAGVPLTSTVAMAPLMLLTITVADGVHVLQAVRTAQRAAGSAFVAATDVPAAIARLRRPIALATVTTVIGFLTMVFSAVPTYRVLGCVVAFGALVAGLLTLFWLPALLRLWLPRWQRDDVPDAALGVERVLAWLTQLPALLRAVVARRVLAVLALVLLVLLGTGWSRLRVDDAFVEYFGAATAFRQAADVQSARLGGLYEIEYAIDSGVAGGIHDPDYLRTLAAFVHFLQAQPETRSVLAWTQVLERIHESVREGEGAPPPEGELPASRQLAANYLTLYQLSLPLGQDPNNLIDVDQSASRVVVRFGDMRSSQMLDVEARIDAWWSQVAAERAALGATPIAHPHGAINLVFSHLGGRNVEAMLWANVWGVLAIAVLIAFALRNLLTGVLSAGMNLVPLGFAFALWGFTVQDVGLSLSVAAGMTLGILDHNAVHLLSAYLRQREHTRDVALALRAALTEVAPGILVTNVALVVGFVVLAQSSFQLNGQLGGFTVLTLLLALLANLVLLPLLVLLRARAAAVDPAGPAPSRDASR